MHHIVETEFGLLPTVLTKNNENRQSIGYGPNLGMHLMQMGKSGLLPTPLTSDKNSPAVHGKGGQDLRTVIVMQAGLLPTPTVNDMKNATLPASQAGRNNSIVKRILNSDLQIGDTSQLNPRFVLEMMGFPPNWTELPFLNGEISQLQEPVTP